MKCELDSNTGSLALAASPAATPLRSDRLRSTVIRLLPCDSWHVKSPSVYATPDVAALMGSGWLSTACQQGRAT